MTLSELMNILHFPTPVEAAVLSHLKNDSSRIAGLSADAYSGEDFAFPILQYAPMDRLLAVIYLLIEKYEEYIQSGIPAEITNATFRDVTLRASLYYQSCNSVGLSKDDVVWFRHIMNKKLFQIGPLQFQPFEMIYLDEETIGESYMSFPGNIKIVLSPGTPVINCHIPRGTDLNPARVSASLLQARSLFHNLYPDVDFKAFLCYSWLLFPDMCAILGTNSNIRKFAERFTIIGTCNDKDQAMECLFPDTSLHQLALDKPEKFGYACGIIRMTQ